MAGATPPALWQEQIALLRAALVQAHTQATEAAAREADLIAAVEERMRAESARDHGVAPGGSPDNGLRMTESEAAVRQQAEAEIQALRRALDSTREDLLRSETARLGLRADLARAEREIARIFGSRSMRLTEPLRWIRRVTFGLPE